MAFPATGLDQLWRNSAKEVLQVLKHNHGNRWMIFNLSDCNYDSSKLDNRLVSVPFADHHPPPFFLLFEIVGLIDGWMCSNEKNVAVVHCVGGKGRTGLIISSLLFFGMSKRKMSDCLALFAMKRSAVGRGVTQPSQRRWCHYFEQFLLQQNINYLPMKIDKIIITGLEANRSYTLEIWDSPYMGDLLYKFVGEYAESLEPLIIEPMCLISGDVHIVFNLKYNFPVTRESKLFHCSYHTFFLSEKVEKLTIKNLDNIDRSWAKSVQENFNLSIIFTVNENSKIKISPTELMVKMTNTYNQRKEEKKRKFQQLKEAEKIKKKNQIPSTLSANMPRLGKENHPKNLSRANTDNTAVANAKNFLSLKLNNNIPHRNSDSQVDKLPSKFLKESSPPKSRRKSINIIKAKQSNKNSDKKKVHEPTIALINEAASVVNHLEDLIYFTPTKNYHLLEQNLCSALLKVSALYNSLLLTAEKRPDLPILKSYLENTLIESTKKLDAGVNSFCQTSSLKLLQQSFLEYKININTLVPILKEKLI